MYAATSMPTCAGSSPKDRVLMTGFAGFELTSATGEKARWKPAMRASAAVA